MKRLCGLLLASLALSGTVRGACALEDLPAVGELGTLVGQDPASMRESIGELRGSLEVPRQLFTIKTEGGQTLIEIRQDQLDSDHLCSATVEKGTGERGIYSAMMADTFLWYFHRAGDKVQFVRKGIDFRAQPGTPEWKAVRNSFSDSVLAATPIVSSDPAKRTIAISAAEVFAKDLINMGERLEEVYQSPELLLSASNSFLESIQAFPWNMEVRAQLGFTRHKAESSSLPDGRLLSIVLRYSLTRIPGSPTYEPRPADSRVGHFQTVYQDFSRPELRDRELPRVHLIERWHLRKKNPGAEVSDVENPIVFWLEDSIPHVFRDAVRAGVLAWNAAFEAIGLRNAVVAKEVDKDMAPEERSRFDPADVSYMGVIRWFMGEDAGFAIGPKRVNPLTGQIFNAVIGLGDLMARFAAGEMDMAGPGSGPAARSARPASREAEYMREMARGAALGLAVLQARGPLEPGERKHIQDEFLTYIVAHEVGHTLGLRHNFKGSGMLGQEDLGKDGLVSSSLMDYLPAHIASKGRAQGPYFQTRVGPYDRWAIEYAYKPLAGTPEAQSKELDSIAARSAADPKLAYGADEDASGADPDVQLFDLGEDPVTFARGRVGLVRELWNSLESRRPSSEAGYESLTRSFLVGYSNYRVAVAAVPAVIGGIRSHRVRPGAAKRPFEPVSSSQEREALRFLDEHVFGEEAFRFPPEFLQRLDGERLGYSSGRPISVAEMVLRMQKGVLSRLYDDRTLRRLVERRALAGPGRSLTLQEVLAELQGSIWKEIKGSAPRSISLLRRNLQMEHLSILAALLKRPGAQKATALQDGGAASLPPLPSDVRSTARRDLRLILADAVRALNHPDLDEESREHLEDVREAVQGALAPSP